MKKLLGGSIIFVFGIFLNLFFILSIIPNIWAQNINNSAGKTDSVFLKSGDIFSPGLDLSVPLWSAGAICLFFLVILVMGIFRYRKLAALVHLQKHIFRKDNEKLKLLVENSEDGVLIVKNLKFFYANRKIYEMMGVPCAAKISDSLVDFIYPEDLGIVLENYEKSILLKDAPVNFEIRLLRPDKTILWVHSRFVPALWDNASVNLVFLKDITSRKKLEKDLQQAQRLEAIGALSGGIAHEFNNILTTIIGNAEVALMDMDQYDFGRQEFERIQESGYRASELVRQILAITREHSEVIEPLSLSVVIKEAMKLLRSTLPASMEIIERITKNTALVKADSIRIHQVFMNLCMNAKDAMEDLESPRLEVELKNESFLSDDPRVAGGLKPGDYVTISVKDNGTGIDPMIENRLFEPYFTTKQKKGAIGLGLTTTLGIVKQFEGFISFQTRKDKGTCFVIYLPVYQQEKFVKTDDEGAISTLEGKILFVDDEKEITLIAKKMFENLGFSVMAANSGDEALQYFKISPDFFDVLITDLAMPGMTGDVLAKEIIRIRPGFPVILCTGHSDVFNQTKARALGIMEYVQKPYNLKNLSTIVSKYINKEIAA